MNISSKILCNRRDVSPFPPQGGGARLASPPTSLVTPSELHLYVRSGSTFGVSLGPLVIWPVRRLLVREPFTELRLLRSPSVVDLF